MLPFLFTLLLLLIYVLVIPITFIYLPSSTSLSTIFSLPWEKFIFPSSSLVSSTATTTTTTIKSVHRNIRNHNLISLLILVNIVFHQQFTFVTSFNLDTRVPFIKSGPIDSYFGYSVAQHIIQKSNSSYSEPILLIGAPRAQTDQPGTIRSGYVFRCDPTITPDDCLPLDIDFKRDDPKPPAPTEFKDDQWLGVTVKSSGPGGHALACAHRYVIKGADHHWGQGICYSLTNYLDYHRAWEPCFNRPVKKAHEEFGFCQAGTSADISSSSDIIIGSPGPYTWRGTVFTNSIKFALRDDKAWYMGPVQESISAVEGYSYLGMSVTSGKFFGNNLNYVGGAPRANGTGQVVFYSKRKSTLFSVDMILSGEQFASSFGYTILAMDFQNDNKSDLVVGAPFYYDGSRSEGAVYIYYNTGKGIQSKYDVRLIGKQDSRFGWSLADLGDINKDGFNDLAVGAPYDDGGGAVYIYLGSQNGIKATTVQVIRGEDIQSFSKIGRPIKTFGYSLSGSADMDKNGYPDLLVGAYESDAAILLRARPILNIATRAENITQIDPNKEGCPGDKTSKLPCFTVDFCFSLMNSGRGLTSIELRYVIEAESFLDKKPIVPRVRFAASSELDNPHILNKTLPIRGDRLERWNCLKELVYIKEKSDMHRSIQFQLTYSLEQDESIVRPSSSWSPSSLTSDIDKYPILNQEEARKVFHASFLKECRNTEQCQSNLNVIAKLLHDTPYTQEKILYLGSTDVNLELTVKNTMEPAYDANIYIYHPYITYIGKDQVEGEQIDCKPFNISLLVCSLGNPFKRGEVKLNLKFDPKEISESQHDVDIRVLVNTSSVDLNQSKNDITTKLLIIRRADLEVKGSSDPAGVWFGGQVVGEAAMKTSDDIGSRIEHSYTIISAGPYHPKELTVEVDWPYSLADDHEEGKWLLYLMSTIVVQGKGQCVPTFGEVNPLKIRDTDTSPIKSDSFIKSRPKRQTVVPAKRIMEDGKSQNVVVLDCQKKTARCYKFLCYLQDLRPGVPSVIVFIGRLWNSTFVEDYASGVNQVHIYSRARLAIGPSIRQNRTNDDSTFAITKAYPDVPLLPPARVPLWIIIMSILLGILLLILLIIVLWRCGFFKRRIIYMAAPVEDKDFDDYN